MTRPVPWNVRPVRTVWLDYPTGIGIDDDGASVKAADEHRLVDMLETARHANAGRIMLTGAIPAPIPGREHWLITPTSGWTPGGHWLQDPPTGRFTHDLTGHRVEVRLSREWFGGDGTAYGPTEARDAWNVVERILALRGRGSRMHLSPAATGMHAWARALPENYHDDPLPADIAAVIHRTSGQHRIEHMTPGRSRCECGDCLPLVTTKEIPEFTYIDGRFMYSALLRELGTGPARWLTADEATQLSEDRYAKARYRVRATVPTGWDTLGLLGAQLPGGEHWHYPNRPGAVVETWCDAVELDTARTLGWRVEILEGIALTKGKPADAFRERLVKARAEIDKLDASSGIAGMARAALRMILLQTVGVWHSTGRDRTIVAWTVSDLPADAVSTMQEYETPQGPAWVYRVPAAANAQTAAYHRPELSAQVWARARARVLVSPVAPKSGLGTGGAIEVMPNTLIGINGDAVYTSAPPPPWALPVDQGGGDDGREGRLRLQGHVPGPLATPTNETERNQLRARAEAAGKKG